MLPGELASEVLAEDRVWSFLKPWISPTQATIWRAATYHFHALVAQRWRQGPIFLAGDACHQMPPFLAQGLNQGVRDAANLAWKLAAVLRGDASDALLDTYERERKANVRAVIGITKDLGRIICERDERLVGERNTRMQGEFAAGKGHFVRQDFLPPLSDGLLDPERRSPGPGEPCPQPWIETTDGWQRMDEVLGCGFRVVVVGDVEVTPQVERTAAAIKASISRIGFLGDTQQGEFRRSRLIERHGVLTTWMAGRSCNAIVVRPDNVVFGIASGTEALARLLARLSDDLKKTSWPASQEPR
jgi:3-(3-hydroxy-phenyl)propionate hydroxylase